MLAPRLPFGLLLLVAVLSACDFPFGSDDACTLAEAPGIRLAVVDSVTAQMADPTGMRVFAQEGRYIEELIGPPIRSEFVGADERPGRYTLTVVSPLYEPWGHSDVRVRGGGCHVETVRLTARLVPLSAP